jgi:RimJ/RimL family protein N-acetyltransferase
VARSARRGGGVFADLPELETERLLLRKMHLDDAQAMFSYASDPEVTRYVLWETHPLVEDSERGEFGGWGVVLKGSGAFVGTAAWTWATRQSTPAPSWATSSPASTEGKGSCSRR